MTDDGDPEKGYDSHCPIKAINDDMRLTGNKDPKSQEIESGADADSNHSVPHSRNSEIETAPETAEHQPKLKSPSSPGCSRPMSIIPRSRRRGLLGRFTIIPEVQRPMEYTRRQKWLITMFVALAAAAAPMGSAIFYPALPQLSADLNSTPTVVNLSVAMYMLSMSIFPLWWSSFSETLGRRTIYIVSFLLFVIFSILSAISSSISMLIVMRILGGGAAASVQAVGAGTIADIWEPKERGRAMGIFYLGPLMGPLLAPIIGGALTEAFGWRSTMWFLAIYGFIILILLTAFQPETLKITKADDIALVTHADETSVQQQLTRVSTRQSVQRHASMFAKVFKRCVIDPLYVLTYLRFPAVALTVYYASITFGVLYLLNISIQKTFSLAPYSYKTIVIGLLYIPGSLGYVVASLVSGKWSDNIMAARARAANRYDESGKLILRPEDRMRENAYIAAFLYPAALLWYGWTVEYHLHWAIASVANFVFGFASMVIFGMSTTMLTEFFPRQGSSGVAVNNFVRNIFSCVGGIIASPLIDAIGNGWLFTGLAMICWLSMAVIWAMNRFGPRWRAKMDIALK